MKRKKVKLTREDVLQSLIDAGVHLERRNDNNGLRLVNDGRSIIVDDSFSIVKQPDVTFEPREYLCDNKYEDKRSYLPIAISCAG